MRIARITSVVLAAVLALPFAFAACGSSDNNDDAEAFPTLQACFDEHHNTESLPTDQAIVVCCTDHPIAGVHPSCGATETDCEAHVGSNLDPADASSAEITTACQEYIADK